MQLARVVMMRIEENCNVDYHDGEHTDTPTNTHARAHTHTRNTSTHTHACTPDHTPTHMLPEGPRD